jgi:recombination protein RecT
VCDVTDKNSSAIVKQTPIAILRTEFEKWKPTLKAVLPKHLDADRVIKMATASFIRSDAIQKCTISSVIKATVMAAELGLEPGSLLGECYLVPFQATRRVRDGNQWKEIKVDEATLIPGYKGLIKLARQSGDVSTISAYAVDTADEFEVELGLDPTIRHKFNCDKKNGVLRAAYMTVKFKDGGSHFDVMTKSEIDTIMARSASVKAGVKSPWTTDYFEMAKKTVIKRGLKMVTLSPERQQLAVAIAADNAAEAGEIFVTEISETVDGDASPQLTDGVESRTAKLSTKLAANVVDGEFDPDTGEVKAS